MACQAAAGVVPFWRQLPAAFGPRGRVAVIAEAGLGIPASLRGHGYGIALVQGIRLAGRLSEILVDDPAVLVAALPLDPAPISWRQRAVSSDIVSDEGF